MRISLYVGKYLKKRKDKCVCVIFGWYGKEEKM